MGTWTLTTEVYANCDDSDFNGTFTYNCATSTDECIKLTFTNDGKFSIAYGDGAISFNGTYSISGSQLTVTIAGSTDVLTFAINGNTLTITYVDEDSCNVTETYVKS